MLLFNLNFYVYFLVKILSPNMSNCLFFSGIRKFSYNCQFSISVHLQKVGVQRM